MLFRGENMKTTKNMEKIDMKKVNMKKSKMNMLNLKNVKTGLFAFIVVLIAIAFLISACDTSQNQNNTNTNKVSNGNINVGSNSGGTFSIIPTELDISKEVKTKQFSSEADFKNFLEEYSGNTYGGYLGYYGGAMIEKSMDSISSSVSAPTAAGPSQGISVGREENTYSHTNNQVDGVDEADIIKTDGNYIYTITGQTLFIIKAYPGEDAKVVSTIKFKNSPQGLFVYENHLAVFGYFYDLEYFKEINFRPRYGMTFFNIYDISDTENPELVKEYKFEGNYFDSRMTGKYAYFVTTTGFDYRNDYPTPLMFDGNTRISMPIDHIYYFDIPYNYPQFANIQAIDLSDLSKSVDSQSVIVEGSQNMYMSEKNIYITYTEYINEYDLRNSILMDLLQDEITDSDKELIQKIEAADSEVLSRYEKKNKIIEIYNNYYNYLPEADRTDLDKRIDDELEKKIEEYGKNFEFTVINKINAENGKITVKENGKVPGHVINQFSMDEYNDVFRIATTISQRWWGYYGAESARIPQTTESTNNIYTLDNNLEIMDKLEGLAPGEQIYSTRFMGNRLYMVTFRQVDPFFAIDLSNPDDIKELGKLKIPGFSTYLHPYDDNTIIGIGRDTTAMGNTQGLKISLFDVTDVENPKEIAKFVTDERYAQSTAEYEHKAFLFSKVNNLLVIPAYSYTYDYVGGGDKGLDYNGAFVFKITKDEITLRGIIDHSKNTDSSNYYYQPMVERSLFIEDLLYTKSPSLLRINKIDNLSSVKNIELKQGTSSTIPIY